ncbi:type II toxin-antitoxin system VapC family toxin [Microbacterium sp. LWS13-1.2]|uniref:Ribonuclease VapC n=1 Tax=Microbacterium sp. LWS13-1.2 TaxID=3135264 RepID=A0AAU6SCJ6_9MICO
MIVDTSAVVALLQDEEPAPFIEKLLLARRSQMSAATLVETRAVVGGRLGVAGLRRLDALLRRFGTEIVPFDASQADAASAAYRDYGRGTGHPARLNFGDTFSYALAHVRDESLLFVGDDFSRTDIRSALEEYGE